MMIPIKKLMGVVETVMGKPYLRMPNIYPWSEKNIFRIMCGMMREEEGTVNEALELTQWFVNKKIPFSLEKNDVVVSCPEDQDPYFQTHCNLHELTHAYGNQHWPGFFEDIELLTEHGTEHIVEKITIEKILHEGLAEYVSLRTRNPVARMRKKEFKNRLEKEKKSPYELAIQLETDAQFDPLAIINNEFFHYILGYGLLETVMRDSTLSTWDAYDTLVQNKPSLHTIGCMIDPAVYEVKE